MKTFTSVCSLNDNVSSIFIDFIYYDEIWSTWNHIWYVTKVLPNHNVFLGWFILHFSSDEAELFFRIKHVTRIFFIPYLFFNTRYTDHIWYAIRVFTKRLRIFFVSLLCIFRLMKLKLYRRKYVTRVFIPYCFFNTWSSDTFIPRVIYS